MTHGDDSASTAAGGLAGHWSSVGAMAASYTAVSVTVTGGNLINAGGLAGVSGGALDASYATGDVTATTGANNTGGANAGGLAGFAGGTIRASYATGDASATATGRGVASAGGLIGNGDVTITASYSTGAATATADTDAGGTASEGGLDGAGSATANNSYWDTDTSGIAATTTATGVGTSTIALQAPTGYGTTTDIFGTWNTLDLEGDSTTTPADPWDFGKSWQYPVLKYLSLKDVQQRPQVTLKLSATSTLEDVTVTITATLDAAAKQDTVVEITVGEGATADETTLTIPATKTESNAATITPADNSEVGENDDVTIKGAVQPGGSGANKPADVTLAIADDESVEPNLVENVRVRTKETLAVVTWDALDGADGYTVEWTSRVSRGEANWSRSSSQEVSGTSTTVRRLVPGADYGFRVSATNMENSTSEDVVASTEGEDDGASPFATMTPDSDRDARRRRRRRRFRRHPWSRARRQRPCGRATAR